MDTLLKRGVTKLRQSRKGVWLTNISLNVPTPPRYRALLDPNPPIDPETELGSDPREKCAMEIPRASAATIALNNRLQDEKENTWEVVWRDNNPANIVAKYICVLITAKDR